MNQPRKTAYLYVFPFCSHCNVDDLYEQSSVWIRPSAMYMMLHIKIKPLPGYKIYKIKYVRILNFSVLRISVPK